MADINNTKTAFVQLTKENSERGNSLWILGLRRCLYRVNKVVKFSYLSPLNIQGVEDNKSACVLIIIIIITIHLFTAIALSLSGSGYFTCKQNMKLVSFRFL